MTQKSILWAEDLEGHRQPSLYYLGEEEGADGTHLVCNWNGAPTDFDDYGLDTLISHSEQIAHEGPQETNNGHNNEVNNNNNNNISTEGRQGAIEEDFFVDYPNPAAELIDMAHQGPCMEPRSRRIDDLDLKECAHLDFLSVPPTSSGLLRRLVKNLISMGERLKQQPSSTSTGSNGINLQEPLHPSNKQNEPPPSQQASKLSTTNSNSSSIPTKQKMSKCYGDRESDRKIID